MTTDRTSEDSDKGLERVSPADNVSRKESIGDKEQNLQHREAVDSNPDRFESVASLRVPNKDEIEPFQIVDGGQTIAASRKVDKQEAGSGESFFEGLRALNMPEDASQEEKDRLQADWSINYIEEKARSLSESDSIDGDQLAFDFKSAGRKVQRFAEATEAQIKNPEMRKVEAGKDLMRPRRGREDDFISLGACRAAGNRFKSLRMRMGLGPGHVDPDLIAATIRNEQHHFKQLYDTGTDNYVQSKDSPEALDEMQSIGPAQMQIRNIRHLVERYPEELKAYKDSPLKAATRPGDAPFFVAAYFANVIEGLEAGEKPGFINEKTWGKIGELYRQGKVNEALIYAYNPDPDQVKHVNDHLAEIWKQRAKEKI